MDEKTGIWIVGLGAMSALFVFGARLFNIAKRKRDTQAQEQVRLREEQRERENELTREIERSREEKQARDNELKREIERSRLGLSSIVGQTELKRRVTGRLTIARSKGWPFPHTLINASDGMGRYTVARAVAHEIFDPCRNCRSSNSQHETRPQWCAIWRSGWRLCAPPGNRRV
jgi:hypothetical protein